MAGRRGQVFWWLSRIMHHNETTWVHEFQILLPLFDKEGSPVTTKYLLCLYKGFNAFSNLGYDYGMPRNWVDMVYSLVVMAAQVYLSALILGTLLNYLVRNNPAEEQHQQTIAALTAHVEERNIPPELRDRMLRHFNFQHKKNLGRNAETLSFLPKSLTVKVAYHKFQSTIDKCAQEGNAFSGCEPRFLDECLSRFKVMHFMPGELLIKKGDLPRELFMVVEGALVVMDDDNRVLTMIRADVPDRPPYANVDTFMFGVQVLHPLIAGLDGECTTLILTKEDADELFQSFPAERERIRENVLANYGLNPNGSDMQLSEEKQAALGQGEWADMREPIRRALKSQRLQTLADFQQAVDTDNCDKIEQLVKSGVSVDLKNYDCQTGLHIATARGHSKMVEKLLELQADPNLTDRWERTPLMDAVSRRHKAIIGLLEQREAEVDPQYLRAQLMKHTISGRVEKVRQILDVTKFDVNVGNYDGRTALHMACAHGHEEVAEVLLRAKAKINATDRFGGTPLKDCVVSGHALLATKIRTAGGVLPAGLGEELLCTAAGDGDIQTLQLLFESHQDMSAGDYDARCALHLAAAEARILAVNFLLTHAADPNSEDRWGGRPLDDALRGGTLYHMYCGKLIQSWGGTAGALKDDEEKMAALDQINIGDALALVQRLTSLGFHKRRIERIGEQELLTSFETCMRVVPTVNVIQNHAEVLADCVEDTSQCITTLFTEVVDVIEVMAKRLKPNSGVTDTSATASVRDLTRMPRSALWEKVRLATQSSIITQANMPNVLVKPNMQTSMIRRRGSTVDAGASSPVAVRQRRKSQVDSHRGSSPMATSREGSQKSAEGPGTLARRSSIEHAGKKERHHHRDESSHLRLRCHQLRRSMKRVEEDDSDDAGADDFEFLACANGIESDEEEALHQELDRIEAQSERMDELGMEPHKLMAQAFLKASTRSLMISESFALLRSLFVARRNGGPAPVAKFFGDAAEARTSSNGKQKAKPEDAEDADDTMVTQFDIVRVLDMLQIDVTNDDIDAIVEEAETYTLTQQPTKDCGNFGRMASSLPSATTNARHDGRDDTAVPLSAVLAGSKSFRTLVCDMAVDHQLCAMLESRLGELLSEDQMQQLELVEERVVKEGDAVHPSLENNGSYFFLVLSGFLTATHPDAAFNVAAPSKQAGGKHHRRPRESRSMQPVHLKQGDVFGAYQVLRPKNEMFLQREVVATSDAALLVISCPSLVGMVGDDTGLSLQLQELMAERAEPVAEKGEDQPQRGLLRGASMRKVTAGFKGAFDRARRISRSGESLFSRAPSSGSMESEAELRTEGRAAKASAALSLGEIQRRGLADTMAVLEDLWHCLTMGHSFVARPLLEVVGQSLGEASSHAFMQIFFPTSREQEHLLVEDEFWRCWLLFTAEQHLDDLDEDHSAVQPWKRTREEDADSEEEEASTEVNEAEPQDKESFLDLLVARFSPSRSLKTRFFEPAVIDQYEQAYLSITGDLKVPLPMDKIPTMLSVIFVDVNFRISKRNAREFQHAFASSEKSSQSVSWADIRSVLKKRRMTVQEHDQGRLFLGTALDPRSRPLRLWGWLTFLVAVYYLATVPVRAAFLPWDSMLHPIPLATDLPADVLTTIAFVLALNTAYRNRRSSWVTSRVRIAKRLPLSLWASMVPLDWLAWLAGADNEVVCFCRLPRMALMLARGRFMERTRTTGVRRQIERMLSMVALTVHCSACIFFFVGRSYHKWVSPGWAVSWYRVDPSIAHLTFERDAYGWHPDSTVWDQYLFSVHWVTATLTVNGLVGPVVPQNGIELVLTILLMILNMTLFRWIIGEISSIIMNADLQLVKRREEYSRYRSFIDSNHLPDELRDEIMQHFHASVRESVDAQKKILSGLCAALAVDRARFLYREIVGNITVLQGCSDAFLDALCVVVAEVHFNPEDSLFEFNAAATEQFLVVSGSISTFMVTDSGEIKDGDHEEGSAPGMESFFFDSKRQRLGRAGRAGATCLRLKRTQFVDIALLFPSDEATIAENVVAQLKKQSLASYASSAVGSVASRGQRSTAASSMKSAGQSSMRAGSVRSQGSKSKFTAFANAEDLGSRAGSGAPPSQASSVDAELREEEKKLAISTTKTMKSLLSQRKTRFLHMLHSAAYEGDAQKVEELLAGTPEVSINDTDKLGRTAMHVAAAEGRVEVVQFLLEHSGDVTIQDKVGNTPLNAAVRHKQDQVAACLRDKCNWLKLKLKKGDAAEMLCQLAVRPDSGPELQRLLDNKIDVNAVNMDDRSALMVAACEGNVQVVELLMKAKADPDMQDKWGKTAMAGAIAENRKEVQEALRGWGVKHGKGEMELTVAMCDAAAANQVQTMRVMVKNGVDPSLGDYDMRTPLHLAASNQNLTVLEFLLGFEPRINVNPIDRFGGTPLEDAYRHDRTAAINLLESHGALRKDDPSQSRAMEEQLAQIQSLQRSQRAPKVQAAQDESLEEQAAKALSDSVVPSVTRDSKQLLLSFTKVLEGFRATLRVGEKAKGSPLAVKDVVGPKWTSVLECASKHKGLLSMRGAGRLLPDAVEGSESGESEGKGVSSARELLVDAASERSSPTASLAQAAAEAAIADTASDSPRPHAAEQDGAEPSLPGQVAENASDGEQAASPTAATEAVDMLAEVKVVGAPTDKAAEETVVVGGNFGAAGVEADAEAAAGEQAAPGEQDQVLPPPEEQDPVLPPPGEQDQVRPFDSEEASADAFVSKAVAELQSPQAAPADLTKPRQPIVLEMPPRTRKITRTIPTGQQVEFASLEEGLEKLMDLLKELKLVMVSIRQSVSEDSNEVETVGDEKTTEVATEWVRESKVWLLVSRRFRNHAAVFKRQLAVCMLMYKLARRVIKEVRRLLHRSRVHENQVRARKGGRRRSATQ